MAGPLRRVVRAGRRLMLGRLSEVGDLLDALAEKLDTLSTELGNLKAEAAARSAALDDRLAILADRLDAAKSPRTLSVGGLVDYQIETARYYLESAVGDIAPGFRALYERCKHHTVASVEQLYAIHTAVDYLARRHIAGDIVDCGAGYGGAAMMAALTLANCGCERRLVLFECFAELTSAGGEAAAADPTGEVRERLVETGYPAARIEIVPGLVERTVPRFAGAAVALLRIDTDSYGATKTVLESLCPRLAAGAVLLFNDAPSLFGPRQAIADFFGGDGKLPLFNRVDYCTRVAVWPG
jgi:Macrocin-O-methyltransferase (TylF)